VFSQSLGVTLHAGNRATFVNDERVFDALAEDVARAKWSIHILSYVWSSNLLSATSDPKTMLSVTG
jgi:hypothetical protein